MSAEPRPTQPADHSVEDCPCDEQTMALAILLASSLLRSTRAEGRYALKLFACACEESMGGTLIIQAPSGRERRRITEVRYASEGISFRPITDL